MLMNYIFLFFKVDVTRKFFFLLIHLTFILVNQTEIVCEEPVFIIFTKNEITCISRYMVKHHF